MAVLVAGANGFIGRHVVAALTRSNSVVQLDRQGEARSPGVYEQFDIGGAASEQLAAIVKRHAVTAIVNCAGTTQLDNTLLAADNIGVTERLVVVSTMAEPGLVFCQIGSGAEYQMLPRPERTREDCPAIPAGDYGKSKLESTCHVLSRTADGAIAGYVLRLFNPVGPGMPGTQLLGKVLGYLGRETREPLELGSLDSYRDYIDARDVARAVVASLESAQRVRGQIVNIGSGTATLTRALVDELFRAADRGAYREDAEGGSARSRWASWQEADISRAASLLDWRPMFSLRQTVTELIQSLKRD